LEEGVAARGFGVGLGTVHVVLVEVVEFGEGEAGLIEGAQPVVDVLAGNEQGRGGERHGGAAEVGLHDIAGGGEAAVEFGFHIGLPILAEVVGFGIFGGILKKAGLHARVVEFRGVADFPEQAEEEGIDAFEKHAALLGDANADLHGCGAFSNVARRRWAWSCWTYNSASSRQPVQTIDSDGIVDTLFVAADLLVA
jgi:hypothetical protein